MHHSHAYTLHLQELQPGTKVLVENTYQNWERKGEKLEDKYKDPYEIHKSLGRGVYELKNMDGKVLKTKHNIAHLKVDHILQIIVATYACI